MLDFYLLILEEADKIWSHDSDVGWRCTPRDLVSQASIIVTLKIHVERLYSFCHNELKPHFIEYWHGNPLKVNTESAKALAFRRTDALLIFVICAFTCFLGVLG